MTEMSKDNIKAYLDSLRYKRYYDGVRHLTTPEWLEDIRALIKCVEFLLEQK